MNEIELLQKIYNIIEQFIIIYIFFNTTKFIYPKVRELINGKGR